MPWDFQTSRTAAKEILMKNRKLEGTESISKGNSVQSNSPDDQAYNVEHKHESVGVPNSSSDPAHVKASKAVTDRAKQRLGNSYNTNSHNAKKLGGAYGE
jgi:hypothetical protein